MGEIRTLVCSILFVCFLGSVQAYALHTFLLLAGLYSEIFCF